MLLAEAGYTVRGIDVSDAMVEAAKLKAQAAGVAATFQQGDVTDLPYQPATCDVVLARHVLWALPDPSSALGHWVRLLRPDGRLVLIEGSWSTGAGLTAADCAALVLQHRLSAAIRPLREASFWGRATDDERYAVISLH